MALIIDEESWLQGYAQLVPQVGRWFREATQQYAPPTIQGCSLFAQHLHVLGPPGQSREPDPTRLAIKNAELFLRHIASKRSVLEQLLRLASIYSPSCPTAIEEHKQMLNRIREVERHFQVLLPYLSRERHDQDEPIRSLAQLARELWAETNNGQVPLWKKTDSPLCKLIEQALESIGQPLAKATISEILRGRRRKR